MDSRTKIEAFFQEFSERSVDLKQHVDPRKINTVRVERIDSKLLDRQQRSAVVEPGLPLLEPDVYDHEKLLVLDCGGNRLATVGYLDGRRWWQISYIAETIGEAINRLGNNAKPFYVLSVFEGNLVLYKTPKGVPDIRSWVGQQIMAERDVICKAVSEIDADRG